LKHIQELETLKIEKDVRTIIIFVVQRPDCLAFQGSNVDIIYKNALNKAHDNGVEIIPIQIQWQENGSCQYLGILPFLK
jgi:DNA-binding sugar fermentation-stimulating protein